MKRGGLGIPIPSHSRKNNLQSSKAAANHLAQTIQENTQLSMVSHMAELKDRKRESAIRKDMEGTTQLKELEKYMEPQEYRVSKRAGETGAWLTVIPQMINGTDLSHHEFRDHLALRYGKTPANLPALCDGCGGRMNITHLLGCKRGDLYIMP